MSTVAAFPGKLWLFALWVPGDSDLGISAAWMFIFLAKQGWMSEWAAVQVGVLSYSSFLSICCAKSTSKRLRSPEGLSNVIYVFPEPSGWESAYLKVMDSATTT